MVEVVTVLINPSMTVTDNLDLYFFYPGGWSGSLTLGLYLKPYLKQDLLTVGTNLDTFFFENCLTCEAFRSGYCAANGAMYSRCSKSFELRLSAQKVAKYLENHLFVFNPFNQSVYLYLYTPLDKVEKFSHVSYYPYYLGNVYENGSVCLGRVVLGGKEIWDAYTQFISSQFNRDISAVFDGNSYRGLELIQRADYETTSRQHGSLNFLEEFQDEEIPYYLFPPQTLKVLRGFTYIYKEDEGFLFFTTLDNKTYHSKDFPYPYLVEATDEDEGEPVFNNPPDVESAPFLTEDEFEDLINSLTKGKATFHTIPK